jgi:hypothetical protein
MPAPRRRSTRSPKHSRRYAGPPSSSPGISRSSTTGSHCTDAPLSALGMTDGTDGCNGRTSSSTHANRGRYDSSTATSCPDVSYRGTEWILGTGPLRSGRPRGGGSSSSSGVLHRYVREAVDLLSHAADELATAMTGIRLPAYAILDGTLIPIDRVRDRSPATRRTPAARRERAGHRGRGRPANPGRRTRGCARPVRAAKPSMMIALFAEPSTAASVTALLTGTALVGNTLATTRLRAHHPTRRERQERHANAQLT